MFRGAAPRGRNLTSFLRFSGPFLHAAKLPFSTSRLAPPWRKPRETLVFEKDRKSRNKQGHFLPESNWGNRKKKVRRNRVKCLWSETRLIRLNFWDTLWEQFCLSDQSALIDAALWREPFKTCVNPQAHNQKLSRANRYENQMVSTCRDLDCSGASPIWVQLQAWPPPEPNQVAVTAPHGIQLKCHNFWNALVTLNFRDAIWEQVALSNKSVLIDASLSLSEEEIPFKTSANPQARDQSINRANLYENEMVQTYRD